jgi:fatty acid kinase
MIAGLLVDDQGLPPLPRYPAARIDRGAHEDSRFDYCLNLIVRRRDRDLSAEPPEGVAGLGDSIEVVGDAGMLRVHIHTDERERVEALFEELGEVHVDSCDYMPDQIRARRARARVAAAQSGTAVIAVCDGPGFERLFSQLGVGVVPGGPKLNPSTSEILAAVEEAPGASAVVLPNSPNVVLAAEEAGRTAAKRVVVAPCHSPQAAAEVLSVADMAQDADDLARELTELLDGVRTSAVAEAARADHAGRFAIGDAVGLVGEEVVAWGSPAEALRGAIEAIADDAEVLTVFGGASPPLTLKEVERLVPDGLEATLLEGGQQTHWWLLAAQ